VRTEEFSKDVVPERFAMVASQTRPTRSVGSQSRNLYYSEELAEIGKLEGST